MKTIVTQYQNTMLRLSEGGDFSIAKYPITEKLNYTLFTVVDQLGKPPINFNLYKCNNETCVQFRFADNMEAKPVKLQALRELPFAETLQVVTGLFNLSEGDVTAIPTTYQIVADNDFIENRFMKVV